MTEHALRSFRLVPSFAELLDSTEYYKPPAYNSVYLLPIEIISSIPIIQFSELVFDMEKAVNVTEKPGTKTCRSFTQDHSQVYKSWWHGSESLHENLCNDKSLPVGINAAQIILIQQRRQLSSKDEIRSATNLCSPCCQERV